MARTEEEGGGASGGDERAGVSTVTDGCEVVRDPGARVARAVWLVGPSCDVNRAILERVMIDVPPGAFYYFCALVAPFRPYKYNVHFAALMIASPSCQVPP